MRQFGWVVRGVIAGSILLGGVAAVAQTKVTSVPDAQVESDVLKALASNSKLAGQTVTSTTVYGTVTLTGSVRDEDSRKLAETIVSRTPGVQKVIDELTLGSDTAESTTEANGSQAQGDDRGSNPLLQSDGTMAAPQGQQSAAAEQPYAQSAPPPAGQQQISPQQPYSAQQAPEPQPGQPQYSQQPPSQQPYSQQPHSQQPYGQQAPTNQQGQYSQQSQPYEGQGGAQTQPAYPGPYGQPGRAEQGQYSQQAPYGQPGQPGQQPPYRTPYGQAPYGPPTGYQQPSGAPYGAQIGGQPVVVPNGAMLRIRINQGLDSRHTQPGTNFQAVVLNDVIADGYVAIPRGASVQGTVVDAERAGALKGRGELALQLTGLNLAGRTYPITSDVWTNVGGDKTSRTVNSAIGLGAVGAIIGGVTGRGAGAAIGAGLGGAAGVGASAATGGGQAFIPAEAILTFHLTQPANVATVSQVEMDRLGSGVQASAQIRRRYAAPPPPPPYGYPVYYPRYPYPY